MSEVKILLVQLIAKDQQELMVLSDEMLQLKLKYARDLIQLYETIAPCKAPNITLMQFGLNFFLILRWSAYAGHALLRAALGHRGANATYCIADHSFAKGNARGIPAVCGKVCQLFAIWIGHIRRGTHSQTGQDQPRCPTHGHQDILSEVLNYFFYQIKFTKHNK